MVVDGFDFVDFREQLGIGGLPAQARRQ